MRSSALPAKWIRFRRLDAPLSAFYGRIALNAVISAMPLVAHPLNVAILAVPEVAASTLFGMVDLFASAGRDWAFFLSGVEGEQQMNPYIVAARREGFTAANGVWVRPNFGLYDAPSPQIVCVPDYFGPPDDSLKDRFSEELAWLRERYAEGATIASACSGALLLAEAGLLAGCEATIHWAYVASLARYPDVRVRADRSLVVAGEGGRIVMAGGGASFHDMALYLIARHVGLKEARQVARTYLLDWREDGQRPFASLLVAKQVEDAVILRCQRWAALNYGDPTPVATMTRISDLPERSFVRRFKKATGLAPIDYVHRLRLEESKHMLETGDDPIEVIAAEIGYHDARFLARLFRRYVGLTPSQYRRRFGGLRRALKGQTGGKFWPGIA
jgi:transcriptional regulator GlxA family with amidase domain